MVDDMMEILAEEGYAEHNRRQHGQVHVERYW
jgi:hypothetical protein